MGKKSIRKVSLMVTMLLPEEANLRDATIFVRDAVKSHSGGRHVSVIASMKNLEADVVTVRVAQVIEKTTYT